MKSSMTPVHKTEDYCQKWQGIVVQFFIFHREAPSRPHGGNKNYTLAPLLNGSPRASGGQGHSQHFSDFDFGENKDL